MSINRRLEFILKIITNCSFLDIIVDESVDFKLFCLFQNRDDNKIKSLTAED